MNINNQKHGLVHYSRCPLEAPNGSYKAHVKLLQIIQDMKWKGVPHQHVWEEAREMEHIVLPDYVAQNYLEVLKDCGFEEVLIEPASMEFYKEWEHNVNKKIKQQERPKGFMPKPLADKLKTFGD